MDNANVPAPSANFDPLQNVPVPGTKKKKKPDKRKGRYVVEGTPQERQNSVEQANECAPSEIYPPRTHREWEILSGEAAICQAHCVIVPEDYGIPELWRESKSHIHALAPPNQAPPVKEAKQYVHETSGFIRKILQNFVDEIGAELEDRSDPELASGRKPGTTSDFAWALAFAGSIGRDECLVVSDVDVAMVGEKTNFSKTYTNHHHHNNNTKKTPQNNNNNNNNGM